MTYLEDHRETRRTCGNRNSGSQKFRARLLTSETSANPLHLNIHEMLADAERGSYGVLRERRVLNGDLNVLKKESVSNGAKKNERI